ncbi:hypothetical protein EAL2_808p05470 (plasmid) [Peptoclostridium acidaminophilum DSM 3953]|uniref:Thioredoxin domain-containing protein n=1 Tax=Peptoclostridium acidaminophilum DSM 3953 TaxID=1286171 RepID=W8TB06_PEPAC|nr:thioredoxin family protein [Peptoclostridium acidaminophilum]AHM58050.1 hypothetical protein EAL2_808p05470 [Peptoclostridium acidaminophilum DSM 3953]
MRQLNSLEQIKSFIESNSFCLLYFSDELCSVCQDTLPKVELMLENYGTVASAKIIINNSLETAAHFSVFTAPTILLYIGGKEFIREARFISITALESQISRYIELSET